MGIFETQFGGAPLINTYQFQGDSLLPDISGFRGLLQGRRAPSASGARQSSGGSKDLKGLDGEVATYRMEEAALEAEVYSEMQRLYNRFENDFSGDWDSYWDSEEKSIKNKLLEFQTRYAIQEGQRQTMAAHRDRYDKVLENKDIVRSVALQPVGGGFMVFGQRRDGRGYSWGDRSEIVSPLTGGQAAEYINTHSKVGDEVFFPVEYNVNKHYDDLINHFTQVKSNLAGGGSTISGPIDPNNQYSPTFSRSDSFKSNRDAIYNVVTRAFDHLSPEGKMSLYADMEKNLRMKVVDTPEGKYIVKGIPNYITTISTSNGRSVLNIQMEVGPDGKERLLDPNNPEEYQAALESHARFVAAMQGQTYLNYDVSYSEGYEFGKERPEPTVGIHTLASDGIAPLAKWDVISGVGSNSVPIAHDLARIQNSLRLSNPALATRFNNIKARFEVDHPELIGDIRNENLPIEQRNVIGQMLARYITESGEFSLQEIDDIYQRQANPTMVTPMNWGQRMLNRALGAVTLGKFTLDTGTQVGVVDNTQSGPEAYATMMMGREITIYQDIEPNIRQYNQAVGYKANSHVRIAGVGTSVLNARDLNPNGLVFVARDQLISNHPWQTKDFSQTFRGEQSYSNWQQMPVYAGRGGDFFIPKSILDETEVETITQSGGQSQKDFVRRKRISEYRDHDKKNTYTLGSEQFYGLFSTKAEADAVIAQIRATYNLNKPNSDIKIVLVPGEVAIEDPTTIDLQMENQYSSEQFYDQMQGAQGMRNMMKGNRALGISNFLRTPATQ